MTLKAENESPGDRAARRRHWPVRRATLADQDDADHFRHLTPAERVGMMWRLAVDGWVLSGRALPVYERADMPGRVIRPGAPDTPESGVDR